MMTLKTVIQYPIEYWTWRPAFSAHLYLNYYWCCVFDLLCYSCYDWTNQ